jgi:hypothetical protein
MSWAEIFGKGLIPTLHLLRAPFLPEGEIQAILSRRAARPVLGWQRRHLLRLVPRQALRFMARPLRYRGVRPRT